MNGVPVDTCECVMAAFAPATDSDRERARHDAAFRHKMLSDHLDRLLSELNRLRGYPANPTRSRQIKEGVALAVKLASLLQR